MPVGVTVGLGGLRYLQRSARAQSVGAGFQTPLRWNQSAVAAVSSETNMNKHSERVPTRRCPPQGQGSLITVPTNSS